MGCGGKERRRRVRHPPYIAPSIKGAGLPLFQALNTCQARDAFAVSKTSLTQIRRQGTSEPRNYRVEAAYTFTPKVPGAFYALKIFAHGKFWKHFFPG